MNKNLGRVFAVVSVLVLSALGSAPAHAQMAEAKEKPPMYSYVAFWTIPRAQWGEQDKETASEQKIMEKALSSGTIVGYGNDQNLIHTPDGETHDTWFSAMSQAGVLNVLDQIYKAGAGTSPAHSAATRHWDGLYVTRFYNWHSGSWKDVYTHVGFYKLKADAPQDALDQLSKNLFVPLLEKMLADGAIHEYEVDTEAIHTDSPSMFAISYVAANAEALDKVSAAVREAVKADPMGGGAFNSMTDFTVHRDYLLRTTATFK